MDGVKTKGAQAIRIGVNAHLLSLAESYRSAGINWYLYNLLQHLPAADPAIGYTLFMNEPRYQAGAGVQVRLSCLPTRHPAARILWEQAVQPWAARREGVDLLHGPAFVGPLLSGRPFVVTIHDLSFLRYPHNFRAGNRRYLQVFTRLSVQRARRVIAVSESTKRDVVHYYGIPPDRVDVIYHGVDAQFQPLPAADVAAFRAGQGLPERFLLFVGTLEPRKNVAHLLQAYARLPGPRPPLVLVGGKGWLYDEIFARVETLGLAGEVRFAGYVPAGDLPWWYNAAELFVYPSLYEGFGLPVLEAMACGVPVVCSDVSSLPEVAGDAALLVDPLDTNDLAEAMTCALEEADLRQGMIAKGLAQAARFSWERAARQLVDTFDALLGT